MLPKGKHSRPLRCRMGCYKTPALDCMLCNGKESDPYPEDYSPAGLWWNTKERIQNNKNKSTPNENKLQNRKL